MAAAIGVLGGVASAGASAMGLNLNKASLVLTQDLFKLQMRQTKRLWAADWAENSWRHGEGLLQNAQQHTESQAMAAAAYFQSERIHRREYRQSAEQDVRAFEMSWRTEAREALRDHLYNLNNRFNNIMLCDAVMLGCAFGLVASFEPPKQTHGAVLSTYVFFLGLSICLFTVSLWASVIVVRRLNEHTASILERKLFSSSLELQAVWKQQLDENTPTGFEILTSLDRVMHAWVEDNCEPLAYRSTVMLSGGVVSLFISAGLLTHCRYIIDFNAPGTVVVFWAIVVITATLVTAMQYEEDRSEKRKVGPYDNSWEDHVTSADDLSAKVTRAGKRLHQEEREAKVRAEDVRASAMREDEERAECAATDALRERFELLRRQSADRRKVREAVVKMVTSAREEREALPEELTSVLNKILYNVDAIDSQTAELVEALSAPMRSDADLTTNEDGLQPEPGEHQTEGLRVSSGSAAAAAPEPEPEPEPMTGPVDAMDRPVSLPDVRRKLGDVARTTLLRIVNTSDESLRLVSGRTLDAGTYCSSLAYEDEIATVILELLPPDEIAARTEVVVAARSTGRLISTSGVRGQLVYTTADESWKFRMDFNNERTSTKRAVHVEAMQNTEKFRGSVTPVTWDVTKEEKDRKENNEVVITITKSRGEEAWAIMEAVRASLIGVKQGFLFKNAPTGLRLRWQKRWCVLTNDELQYYDRQTDARPSSSIMLQDVTGVYASKDSIQKNVFEVSVCVDGRDNYRFSAGHTPKDAKIMEEWVTALQRAANVHDKLGSRSTVAGDESFDPSSARESTQNPRGNAAWYPGKHLGARRPGSKAKPDLQESLMESGGTQDANSSDQDFWNDLDDMSSSSFRQTSIFDAELPATQGF